VALTARSIRHFVQDVRHLYVVSSTDPQLPGTVFVDERRFPFDLKAVRSILGVEERAGWYLQQLIKLYFPLVMSESLESLLVVDADTIFLRACRFTDGRRTVLNFGDEYHAPYFEHMARLHPALRKMFAYSGICHTMLLTRPWLSELMGMVETQHAKKPFWQIFLECLDPVQRPLSGASEYEIYFNFCLRFHPLDVTLRRFHWKNAARVEDVRAGTDDYVSLHHYLRREKLDIGQLTTRIFNTDPTPG
jgi:hypothetical protein